MRNNYIGDILVTCLIATFVTAGLSILGITEGMTWVLSSIAAFMNLLYLLVMWLATIHISRLPGPTAQSLTENLAKDKILENRRLDTWLSTIIMIGAAVGVAFFDVSYRLLVTASIMSLIYGWKYFTYMGSYHEDFTDISK